MFQLLSASSNAFHVCHLLKRLELISRSIYLLYFSFTFYFAHFSSRTFLKYLTKPYAQRFEEFFCYPSNLSVCCISFFQDTFLVLFFNTNETIRNLGLQSCSTITLSDFLSPKFTIFPPVIVLIFVLTSINSGILVTMNFIFPYFSISNSHLFFHSVLLFVDAFFSWKTVRF